jgi:hypothetical protein
MGCIRNEILGKRKKKLVWNAMRDPHCPGWARMG